MKISLKSHQNKLIQTYIGCLVRLAVNRICHNTDNEVSRARLHSVASLVENIFLSRIAANSCVLDNGTWVASVIVRRQYCPSRRFQDDFLIIWRCRTALTRAVGNQNRYPRRSAKWTSYGILRSGKRISSSINLITPLVLGLRYISDRILILEGLSGALARIIG